MRIILFIICFFLSQLLYACDVDQVDTSDNSGAISYTSLFSPDNDVSKSSGNTLKNKGRTKLQDEDVPDLTLLKNVIGSNYTIQSIQKTVIHSIYKLVIDGQIYYITQDGNYLFQGDMIDLKEKYNITASERNQRNLAIINNIPPKDFITFPAKKSALIKHKVVVFIDFDCPYCEIFLDHVSEYQDLGFEIKIASFPRKGMKSFSAVLANKVWCAEDRQQALFDASRRRIVESDKCDAPIKEFYNVANVLGINGTPSFILEDGSLIQGFVSPSTLQQMSAKKKTN